MTRPDGSAGRAPRRHRPRHQGAHADGRRPQPPRQLASLIVREVEDSLRRLRTDRIDLFVLRHPAITAPIIGPRTMEHLESQLAAADVVLSDGVLDRIDEFVAPGVTINPAENGWVSPSLQPAARRR